MMDDTFFQEWVVLRQQGVFAQYRPRLPHDQSDKPKRYTKIEQVQRNMIRIMMGEDHLIEIQPVPEYQQYGHKSHR